MIIKEHQLNKTIDNNSELIGILIYGPNEGLINEKIKNIISSQNDYDIISVTGKDLDSDEFFLDQALGNISLFGTTKILLIENLKDKYINQISEIDLKKIENTILIIKSGILPKSSKLRKYFESHDKFASLACYEDDIRALMKTIELFSKENSIIFNREIKDYLLQTLSIDRMVNVQELEKIKLLYGNSSEKPELEKIKIVLNDSSSLNLNKINEAVMFGKPSKSSKIIFKLFSDGTNPVAIIRSLINYIKRLESTIIELKKGNSFDDSIRSLKPAIFWKDKENFQIHCRKWPLSKISELIDMLTEAEVNCKLESKISRFICERTVLNIAYQGRKYF